MEQAQWYVVHTYSGYENKVAQNLTTIIENRRLQEWIQEVRVPTEVVPDIKDGKERMVERKLFPGYVLVKMVMTDDSWTAGTWCATPAASPALWAPVPSPFPLPRLR